MKKLELFYFIIGKINKKRFGAPSRPLRSLEDVIAFLGGSDTYSELADFNSYSVSSDINQDQ